jgi:hypothetical protein
MGSFTLSLEKEGLRLRMIATATKKHKKLSGMKQPNE